MNYSRIMRFFACGSGRRRGAPRPAGRNWRPAGRPSGLAAALLRIGASLDLDTVLREVVACARGLTGARYGAIATIDDAHEPRDFVTSAFTEAEHRAMAEWADGPKLFAFFPTRAGLSASPT